ncbi:MAG: MFS transporter [Acidimicrobiales bacterium]
MDTPGDRPSGVRHGLRAFRHRDFRRFWLGALVSNSGTWLQNLALPYVLLQITGRASWAGFAAFASLFPSVFLAPFAGNVADRWDRRRVLIVGQTLAAVAALSLAALWASGERRPGVIVGVAALGGLVGGFLIPTWQSFIPLLVPNEDLPSAISMNSLQFNIARGIGPAVGGAFIAAAGPGAAFLANAFSFSAVLLALLVIDPGATGQVREKRPVIAGFVEAIRYTRGQPGIGVGILAAVIVASLGFPIVTFVVVFAEQVYDIGPTGLGVLSSLLGVGAILGAPIVSGMLGDLARGSVIRVAFPVYGVAVIVFGLSTSPWIGAVGLLGAGMAFISVVATSNTAVQSIVADRIRGRVMSLRIMTFQAAYPLGALVQTRLSDATSPRAVVTGAGLGIVVIGLFLAGRPALLARLDDPPDPG